MTGLIQEAKVERGRQMGWCERLAQILRRMRDSGILLNPAGALKTEAQADLYHARRADRGGYPAEGGRGQVQNGHAEMRGVEEIVDLDSQGDLVGFLHVELFHHRQIQVEIVRAAEGVPS